MRCVPYSFAAVCLLLSLLLPATMLLSVRARSQESAPAQAPATESPKADSEQPPSSAAPAPAAPGAPSPAPPPASPGSVPVPQVVVKPTAPKPAAPVAGPAPAAAPPPPPAAAPPRRTALRTRRAAQPAPRPCSTCRIHIGQSSCPRFRLELVTTRESTRSRVTASSFWLRTVWTTRSQSST
jgi:outer membrane biosynthesis protein TonB